MSIFDDIRAKGVAYRLTEETLYAAVLKEIESGQRRDGLWAKALAGSGMDSTRAQAQYIKLRVQALKDEVALFKAGYEREQLEEKEKYRALDKARENERLEGEKRREEEKERQKLPADHRRDLATKWGWCLTLSFFFVVATMGSYAANPKVDSWFFNVLTPILMMIDVGLVFFAIGLVFDSLKRLPDFFR